MEHPEELSKVAGLQKKVDEVKGIMVDNIEQVNTHVDLRPGTDHTFMVSDTDPGH